MKLITMLLVLSMLLFNVNATASSQLVRVAPSGGDYDNIIDALNSITGASQNKPYVVQVAPGQYYLSGQQVNLKPFVSLIGTSPESTIIQSAVGGENREQDCAVIVVPKNAKVSNLTVRNFHNDETSVHCGIAVTDGYAISAKENYAGFLENSVENVHVLLKGQSKQSVGVLFLNNRASVEEVSINVVSADRAYGIVVYHGSLIAEDIEVTASALTAMGVLLDISDVQMSKSFLKISPPPSRQYGVLQIALMNDYGYARLKDVLLYGQVAYAGGSDPTRGAELNNIEAYGDINIFNNPSVYINNSIISRDILNDHPDTQCKNVSNLTLSPVDC